MESVFKRFITKANIAREPFENECRATARAVTVGPTTALCRVLGGPMMYVDTRDLSLAPHLMLDGYWESWVTLAIARHVRPGMRCIDVGANVGYFTLLLGELVGANGFVTGYEPQAPLVELANRSLRVAGYAGRAHVNQNAVGATRSAAELKLYGDCMADASFSRPSQPTSSYQVKVDPLDGLSLGRVDFVKIDAEGSEPAIWQGMQRLLRAHSPVVAAEFNRDDYEDPDVVLRTYQSAGGEGYSLNVIDHDGSIKPTNEATLLDGAHKNHNMLWLVPR